MINKRLSNIQSKISTANTTENLSVKNTLNTFYLHVFNAKEKK